MIIIPTPLSGAFIIDIEPHQDERGLFARTVCIQEFEQSDLNGHFAQQSVSWNPHQGTLRGLHYQSPPYEEDKLVRVTRGAIFDVIVDIRSESSSFGQWFSVELSADNRRQLYIPKGFAHGFQTLASNTEVFYQMTVPFNDKAARGLRWDDIQIGIGWPDTTSDFQARRISPKDTLLPTWKEVFGDLQ